MEMLDNANEFDCKDEEYIQEERNYMLPVRCHSKIYYKMYCERSSDKVLEALSEVATCVRQTADILKEILDLLKMLKRKEYMPPLKYRGRYPNYCWDEPELDEDAEQDDLFEENVII